MTRAFAGFFSLALDLWFSTGSKTFLLRVKLETAFIDVAFLATVTALWDLANRLRRLRFPITNGGNVSAVTLDHVENIQGFGVLSIVDVVRDPELDRLAPSFERLHDFGESIVDYICLGVEKLLDGGDCVDLVGLNVAELVKIKKLIGCMVF